VSQPETMRRSSHSPARLGPVGAGRGIVSVAISSVEGARSIPWTPRSPQFSAPGALHWPPRDIRFLPPRAPVLPAPRPRFRRPGSPAFAARPQGLRRTRARILPTARSLRRTPPGICRTRESSAPRALPILPPGVPVCRRHPVFAAPEPGFADRAQSSPPAGTGCSDPERSDTLGAVGSFA
jgi:hypothetical protein